MSGRSKFSFYLGSCFGADQGTQRSSFMGSIKLSPRRYDHDHECKCCDGRRERSCLRLHDIFAVLCLLVRRRPNILAVECSQIVSHKVLRLKFQQDI